MNRLSVGGMNFIPRPTKFSSKVKIWVKQYDDQLLLWRTHFIVAADCRRYTIWSVYLFAEINILSICWVQAATAASLQHWSRLQTCWCVIIFSDYTILHYTCCCHMMVSVHVTLRNCLMNLTILVTISCLRTLVFRPSGDLLWRCWVLGQLLPCRGRLQVVPGFWTENKWRL